MNEKIDIIKPNFILIEGTLLNTDNICSIKNTNRTGYAIQVLMNCDATIDSMGYFFTVSVADMWNALVALQKP